MTNGMNYGELSELAADLGRLASPQAINNVQTAVEVTARRIKDAWNGKLYTDGHASKTGRSVSYDVGVARDFHLWQTDVMHGADSATIVAEVGPKRNLGRQAGVVRLLENGSVHNPPHGYGTAALGENEADFEYGIARAIADAARDAGFS